jgi:iron uptake system component EfeO
MPQHADRAKFTATERSLAVGAALLCAVTVSEARAVPLDDAAERYRPYMIEEIDQSLAGARTLRERIAAKDRQGAQQAWIAARIGWERAEVFTSGFVPDLDAEIDAWPNALAGFHAIEAKLFGADLIDATTEADALIFHLADLDVKIHNVPLAPQRLLNGTARLAYEIGENKADGGESRLSGTSLDDMRNNMDGIALAYRTIFAPALEADNPPLAAAMQAQIERLKGLLDVPGLKNLDPIALRAASEELVVTLQKAAPGIGLRSPSLEEIVQ